jgi:hypothetical protein
MLSPLAFGESGAYEYLCESFADHALYDDRHSPLPNEVLLVYARDRPRQPPVPKEAIGLDSVDCRCRSICSTSQRPTGFPQTKVTFLLCCNKVITCVPVAGELQRDGPARCFSLICHRAPRVEELLSKDAFGVVDGYCK